MFRSSETAYRVYERGREGSGPALVFLHYFGGSARSWHEVIARLSGNQHCLALDLPGFGEADEPSPGDYSLECYADGLARVLAELELKRYCLVGHSMGGKLALWHASQPPAGLAGLVLLASSPPTPAPMKEDERQRMLTTHGTRQAALDTLGKITAQPLPPALLERAVEDNLRVRPAAWRWWVEEGSRADVSAVMRKITLPVVVLAGAKDPVIPPALLECEVVGRLTNARLEVIPDIGHLQPLEAPKAVADYLKGLL